MTYRIGGASAATLVPNGISQQPNPTVHRRGGTRIDTSSGASGRPKHLRSRFTPIRRKEVQEVRRIGACSRCRILRKTCDNKTPCTACEKVINPRVWNAGCIRDRLIDHVGLWSAGVQVVLSQSRGKIVKDSSLTTSNGTRIQATHFYDLASCIECPVLVGIPKGTNPNVADAATVDPSLLHIIMIETDRVDLPQAVENYMRQTLPQYAAQEPLHFVNVTLRTAMELHAQSNDRLLRLALDLWCLTEIIDREPQWNVVKVGDADDGQPKWMDKPPMDAQSTYTQIAGQLSAAAERRANATSEALLKQMHRDLHDSKIKVTVNMYFAALLLLHSIEKYAWLFYAYDQEMVRGGWPLTDKEPRSLYENVGRVAENLKTLLSMRKILPQTERSAEGRVVTQETNPVLGKFFEDINLECESTPSPHFLS
jgi:hypothetical protein